jgi:hypothetical protein
MAKIMVECSDPNSLSALEEAVDQAAGKCNITYFKQHEAMVEAGTSKSQRESARKIAASTGESEEAARKRIERGRAEVVGQVVPVVSEDVTPTEPAPLAPEKSKADSRAKVNEAFAAFTEAVSQIPPGTSGLLKLTTKMQEHLRKHNRDINPAKITLPRYGCPSVSHVDNAIYTLGIVSDRLEHFHFKNYEREKFIHRVSQLLKSMDAPQEAYNGGTPIQYSEAAISNLEKISKKNPVEWENALNNVIAWCENQLKDTA